MKDTVLLYTESAPMADGGRGCNVLCDALIRLSETHVDRILTLAPADTERLNKINIPWIMQWQARKVGLRRVSPLLKMWVDIQILKIQIALKKNKLRTRRQRAIFAFTGGMDWAFLSYADVAARALDLPLWIYLVDDYETSQRTKQYSLGVVDRLREIERVVLSKAERVLTISEGYADHIHRKLGVKAEWLPPPIAANGYRLGIPPPSQNVAGPFAICFHGTPNHLYEKGLLDLADAIRRSNTTANRRIILKMICREIPESLRGYVTSGVIRHVPGDTHKRVLDEVGSSSLAFMPYSFSDDRRIMVSTSFPTKFTEILSTNIPVLIYAPVYASTQWYARRMPEGAAIIIDNKDDLDRFVCNCATGRFTVHPIDYGPLLRSIHQCDHLGKLLSATMGS